MLNKLFKISDDVNSFSFPWTCRLSLFCKEDNVFTQNTHKQKVLREILFLTELPK